jgi:hypothetical protein
MAEELKPPEGYGLWLQYAIDTMDTRSAHLDSIASNYWGRVVQRSEMTDAAQAELEMLQEAFIESELKS